MGAMPPLSGPAVLGSGRWHKGPTVEVGSLLGLTSRAGAWRGWGGETLNKGQVKVHAAPALSSHAHPALCSRPFTSKCR